MSVAKACTMKKLVVRVRAMLRFVGSLVALGILVGCSSAPSVAPPIDPNFKILDQTALPGEVNFLLTSEGGGFMDRNGDRPSELQTKQDNQTYTTRLNLVWSKRFNPANQVAAYGLKVSLDGVADASHTFSANLPTAFLEADGLEIPSTKPAEFEQRPAILIRNFRDSSPPSLMIEISAPAAQKILQAQREVSVKVQLRSDRIARSAACLSPAGSVDDYARCQFVYTGRTLKGAELGQLQQLFKN